MQVACLMSSHDFPSYFSDLLTYGRRQRESDPSAAAVVSRLEGLSLNHHHHQPPTADVTQLYADSGDLRGEHAAACGEITAWMRRRVDHTDPVLNILLCMVMLFNPDVDEDMLLEDGAAVARVQDTFVKIATRYVASEYGDISFGEGMRRIVNVIRRFNRLHDERLKKCKD